MSRILHLSALGYRMPDQVVLDQDDAAPRDIRTRPLRILLAEDNPTNQLVARQMLRELAASLSVASNGAEALKLASEFSYDVILMDMQMPEMNGIEATRAIRARGGALAQVPIVAFTANADPEDIKACLDAGMSSFVAKPVRKKALIEAIQRALTRGADVAAGSAPVAVAGERDAAEQALMMDRSMLDEFIEEVGGDATRQIVTTFLSETERRLGGLRDLSCDDREAIQFESHTLIGSSGMFGMMRLSAYSRQLQRRAATIMPEEYRLAVAEMMEIYATSRRELHDYLQTFVEEPEPAAN